MKNRYAYVAVPCLWAGVALGQSGQASAGPPNESSVVPPVITAGAMSEPDSELLSTEHAALVRATHFYDYDLGNGNWTVNQAVCSEATGYLIVQMSEGGPGAESFFTAVIPRRGGTIRIIPLLHQGIRNRWKFGEDEQQWQFLEKVIPVGDAARGKATADWMHLAGCYAALEGVSIDSVNDKDSVLVEKDPSGPVHEVAFAGTEPDGEPITWRIQYDSHGKISAMEATSGEDIRSIPNTAPSQSKAVPESNPKTGKDVRAISDTTTAQPKPVPVSNPPAETQLRAIPNTAAPEPRVVPTPNPPAETGLRAIPAKAMAQPTLLPASNPPVKTDLRSTPNTAGAQPNAAKTAKPKSKPVPAEKPPAETPIR